MTNILCSFHRKFEDLKMIITKFTQVKDETNNYDYTVCVYMKSLSSLTIPW